MLLVFRSSRVRFSPRTQLIIFIYRFTLDPSVSLPRVAETLPFTFTGADLYALCSDAMLKAVTRSARAVDARVAALNAERARRGGHHAAPISVAYYFDHHADENDPETQVLVREEDFALARKDLVPSVSLDELRHYERVREQFEGATKKQPQEQQQQLPTINTGSRGAAAGAEIERPFSPASSLGRSSSINGSAPPGSPRARLLRLGSGARPRAPGVNGGGSERTYSLSSRSATAPDDDSDADADADEDYVIKTDRLALQDPAVAGRASPVRGGKGKGKGREVVGETEPLSPRSRRQQPPGGDDGEDLYD